MTTFITSFGTVCDNHGAFAVIWGNEPEPLDELYIHNDFVVILEPECALRARLMEGRYRNSALPGRMDIFVAHKHLPQQIFSYGLNRVVMQWGTTIVNIDVSGACCADMPAGDINIYLSGHSVKVDISGRGTYELDPMSGCSFDI